MNWTILALVIFVLSATILASSKTASPQGLAKSFPKPDFILQGKQSKPEKPHVVLGPIETDGEGRSKGSFAVLGGRPLIEVSTVSLSDDGKLLAAGSTPGFVDVWDVESRSKLLTLDGASTVALSPDGSLLAKNGEGIELCGARTGRLRLRISRPHKFPDNTIQEFDFSPTGKLLHITANSEDDSVYDVETGRLASGIKRKLPETRESAHSGV